MSDILDRRDEIVRLATSHGASQVRLFGSTARGEDREGSDVDLLVRMAPDRSLIDRIQLIHDLEDLLHSSVDVVNERALHPAIRDQVLAGAVLL